MITRITGVLTRVLDDEVRLQLGGLEYAVLVADLGLRFANKGPKAGKNSRRQG